MMGLVFRRVGVAILVVALAGGCDRRGKETAPRETVIGRSGSAEVTSRTANDRERGRAGGNHEGKARMAASARTAEPRSLAVASGKVSLPDGAPAENALVTLWTQTEDKLSTMPWYRVASARTDAKGHYKVSGRRGKEMGVTVRKDGYAVAAREDHRRLIHRGPGVIYFDSMITLEPGVVVQGQVAGTADVSTPINVMLLPERADELILSELNTYATATGEFHVSGVPAGAGRVVVSAPDRTRYHGNYNSVSFLEVPVLKPAFPVSGKLVLEQGSFDFTKNDVRMILRGLNTDKLPRNRIAASVDKDGAFTAPWAEKDLYSVLLESEPDYLRPNTDRNIEVMAGKDLSDVQVPVVVGHKVSGVVRAADTSAPLSGVKIYRDRASMLEKDHQAVTTASGTFSIDGVIITNEMCAVSDAYHKLPWRRNRDSADATSVVLYLERTPYVRGHVATQNGNVPLGLMMAQFDDERYDFEGSPVIAATDGSFAIPVYSKTITVAAEAPGYPPVFSEPISIGKEDVNNLVLTLGEGRDIDGAVVSSGGLPVGGSKVSVYAINPKDVQDEVQFSVTGKYNPGSLISETVSDDAGRFSLKQISDQVPVCVLAEHAAYPFPAYRMLQQTERESTVSLLMNECTSATIYITDEDDTPVTNVQVSVFRQIGAPPHTESSTYEVSGTVELERIPLHTTSTLTVSRREYFPYQDERIFTGDPLHVRLKRRDLVSLTVRCLDAVTNEPVKADVQAKDKECRPVAVAGKTGEFSAVDVIPGVPIRLTIEAEGYDNHNTLVLPELNSENLFTVLLRKPGTLTGRVIDGLSHQAIRNAEIFITSIETTTVTNKDGKFTLSDPEKRPTKFQITIGTEKRSPVIEPPGHSSVELDLGDIPLYGKVPARLLVLDAEGKGVEGVNVLTGSESGGEKDIVQGLTDKNGVMKFEAFAGDRLMAGILKPGLKFREIESERDIMQIKDLLPSGYSIKERTIVLNYGMGSITGRLLHEGQPKPGSIKVKGLSQAAPFEIGYGDIKSDGIFKIENLSPGLYQLTAKSPAKPQDLEAIVKVEVRADATPITRDIELQPTDRSIAVTVINESGDPVAEARVVVKNEQGVEVTAANTGATGKMKLSVETSGNYRVSASHSLVGVSLSKGVIIKDSEPPGQVELVLKSHDAQVDCTVLSYLDGLPVSQASGQLIAEDNSIAIDASPGLIDGDLRFRNVAPGNYTMSIKAEGFGTINKPLTVASGDRLELSEVLMPAAQVSVRVTDSRGYFIPRTVVVLNPGRISATTGEDGNATFADLAPASYKGTATSPGGSVTQFDLETHNQPTVQMEVMVTGK